MKTSLFSWRTFLRFIIIILLAGMMIYTAINSFVISYDNAKVQRKQMETLTNLLISQSALSASQLLKNDDRDGLSILANHIASEKLVSDVAIYGDDGLLIASNDEAKSVREILGMDTPLQSARIGKEILLSPVLIDEHIVGFIRITFEKEQVTAVANHHYRNNERLMYMMILFSFISGVLIALLVLYKPKEQIENMLVKDLYP